MTAVSLVVLCSCGEYNAVLKSSDYEYKYEVAKACYVRGEYSHAADLFSELLGTMKGTSNGEECLLLMAMSSYMDGDLESASTAFKKYYTSYPRGFYVELAHYYSGRALYDGMPDPRLDQTMTHKAIDELQLFLDRYPNTKLKPQTQEMIEALQDHLIEKEYLAAKLYYDLGSYVMNTMGRGSVSNYESCIASCENAMRDFPYASAERREQFAIMILRSRYRLARQSVEEKRLERYRQTVDEYYGFANEFPESKYLKEAQGYLTKSQKALKGQKLED